MIYRILGKTGLNVSQLGFGAMRLPMIGEGDKAIVDLEKSTPMIHKAFEGGVNYIDSAIFYCNGDGQKAVGHALKGWRDKVIVSTKNHYYDEDEKTWWTNLENSLEYLQVDYIDIYNHHGINWNVYTEKVEPRVGKWMEKALDQGLIKHIGASFHDNCESLVKIIDRDYIDVVTLQYNMLDRSLEEGIAHAASKDVGVVVMGPVAGGRLGVNSPEMAKLIDGVDRVPELAMRFVLANPHVTIALSGMSTMEQVEENLQVCSDPTPLSNDDKKLLDQQLERLKKMAELYCTGCGYCVPCPTEVNIPKIFELYNLGRVYGMWENARSQYAGLSGGVPWMKGNKGDVCAQCGDCEDKCPQKIDIRKQLAEAHEALEK